MSPEAYENALDRQYDDHVAEMEEMGFDAECAEWYEFEEDNDQMIEGLVSYLAEDSTIDICESIRLRDNSSLHSWAKMFRTIVNGTDKEIADYMRSIVKEAVKDVKQPLQRLSPIQKMLEMSDATWRKCGKPKGVRP